ncbi:pyridoxamine 5'-phosphate oxidase family protein [Streptomyces sp. CHA1]|uniref:pyridoxamine 5'-phosphate oxidase family protein n=1 Tax=Streptomyces TaxID=1883 RepID=UPI001BFC91ED|nr:MULTISPECIES: pyridoxamine 5'-phosphate oxidase family protein [unclassified Streptomyces]WTD01399.1 pyridoxamine 5'-phosphate oxidase family protein [Streptomyces albidoflavus]MBT3160567.1 pyridoxamine 5'-phosphate oxidase family protein [Streptomyces sp. G11C]MCO6704254.1 pyridoxamine 5'-phosphate oxidase family protein [Streptomyces sp. CHB9.2]MCO6710527.1 pyridoxamine 5'-phosphate oxidase family protein [Streptomyces sp. CHA3]MCO6716323.1 pyridoxamine 5'-phosphate oxidase family protein
MLASLPERVTHVFENALSCEVSTIGKGGGPVTFPMMAMWRPENAEFHLVTGIGLPKKIENIERDSRVSLLFSEFAGSGLHAPANVLVQGRATVGEEALGVTGLEDFWEEFFRRKPHAIDALALNPEAHGAISPAFMWRVRIIVAPERVFTLRQDPNGEQHLEGVS